ncbi:hypothetical protein [Gordonia sp. (in: high G+C Gram-positive bacteria)]|uniref:hypothetical protein n=1 Tax=Gordonia sp. (in: high G+C Gram-positive bacteria) TaxID=84139 RepID=UPI003F9A7117
MQNHTISPADIPLLVIDDDTASRLAHELTSTGRPVAIVGRDYRSVVPFMVGRSGYTVALVADVDDPIQLADVFDRVESRLGPVTRTLRVK